MVGNGATEAQLGIVVEEVVLGLSWDAVEHLVDASEHGAFSGFVCTIDEMDVVGVLREIEFEISEGTEGGDVNGVESHGGWRSKKLGKLLRNAGREALEHDGGDVFFDFFSIAHGEGVAEFLVRNAIQLSCELADGGWDLFSIEMVERI